MPKEKGINDEDVDSFVNDSTAIQAKLSDEFGDVAVVDPDAVMARMAGRVHKAQSIDELFDTLTGTSSDALVGKSFTFKSVTWQPYESQRGTIPLAVCDVTDLATGEETEFVTTGFMLVNFLRRAQVIGALPFDARIVAKKTNSGQTALNFERV